MKKTAQTDGPVIIKKYANRRLYNTESSSYITLDHLAAMTREGRDFKVVDAKTDEDITHNVLTQIIMEEEARGQTLLPVNFLRQLIALYGDSDASDGPGVSGGVDGQLPSQSGTVQVGGRGRVRQLALC
ncbi:polyhydroxyalkanoate synthesis repressor PhaR [Sphingomonas sp. J344]|nr:polyhydroxyalkanoate synthesis repressor PhaR [Sphingomonas sp. J344]MCR5869752.1 polyhydroxyalkanoate synthesis repressor PhaR [Sphingomonas sp. J344]